MKKKKNKKYKIFKYLFELYNNNNLYFFYKLTNKYLLLFKSFI